ncbi:MAG: PEP-CTERM sorting domain-containing protein [Pseudomonadota bacterium]
MKSLVQSLALLALAAAPAAYASPIIVDPTAETSSVDISINSASCAWFSPCSITAELSDTLDDDFGMLAVGDEWSFDFFDILVDGLGTIGDASISATLGFSEPDALTASSGNGSFFTFFGVVTGGALFWEQPDYINLEDGSTLVVEFDDLVDVTFGNAIPVSARVRRIAQVPEPATLALFGAGLLMLGLAVRRRRGVEHPQSLRA